MKVLNSYKQTEKGKTGGMESKEIIRLSQNKIQETAAGKRVLFITTKELEYIRNSQEIKILEDAADKLKVIGSASKKYPVRVLKVYAELLRTAVSEYDLVFIGFAPQLVLPFWKWKLKKKQIVIDFFISMYDTFVDDRKAVKKGSFAAKLLKKIDKSTLKAADAIVCDTNAHGKFFCDELGADAEKLMTLYMEADGEIYSPEKSSGLSLSNKEAGEFSDKFVVLYFGSVLPLQGIDVILEAYGMLKNDNRFYFYMIGPVGEEYDKPTGQNIEYISWLSQQELAEHIARADLCLAGHFNDSIGKAKRTIPGKAYIYHAMGKPMILGDNPANRELFSEEDDGIYYVRMGSGTALRDRIIEIMERYTNSKEGK